MPAETMSGQRESWVEMQAVASLQASWATGASNVGRVKSMNCASSRRWLLELEPEAEELLGAAAAFGVGGGCQRIGFVAILVL